MSCKRTNKDWQSIKTHRLEFIKFVFKSRKFIFKLDLGMIFENFDKGAVANLF